MGVGVGVWMEWVGWWVGGGWANVYVKCRKSQGFPILLCVLNHVIYTQFLLVYGWVGECMCEGGRWIGCDGGWVGGGRMCM